MPRGKTISEDLGWVLVYMATTLSLPSDTITNLTNVPRRTVQRVLSKYRQTGRVVQRDVDIRGRKRILQYDDLAVCLLFRILH